MSEFREYMHVERFGNDPVLGIEIGEVYVFPKLDGTNSSLWATSSSLMAAGSRHRVLSLDNDNQGFFGTVIQDTRHLDWCSKYPNLRLYGEFLIPHTLKTYREDVWKKFWIFDVFDDSTQQYLAYNAYQPLLEEAKLDYIPPLAIIRNADSDHLIRVLESNTLFIQDGKGIGEGIVIKNYDWYNKDNQQIWAKIIASEFKEQHYRTMGAPVIGGSLIEEEIVTLFLTTAMCEKAYNKIRTQHNGWISEYIPELLGRVWHDLVTEEIWEILKHKKFKRIDFSLLRAFVNKAIKLKLPEVF